MVIYQDKINSNHHHPEIDDLNPISREIAHQAEMIFWIADADGVCSYVNPGAAKFIASPSALEAGRWIDHIYAPDRVRVSEHVARAWRTAGEYRVQYRMVRSDGSIRWMESAGAPQLSSDGKLAAYCCVAIDVSEARQELALVSQSEAEYRRLTECGSDVVCHQRSNGEFLYVSPASKNVLGYLADELMSANIFDITDPRDTHLLREEIRLQTDLGSDSRLIQVRMHHKNGDEVWIGMKLSVLRDPSDGSRLGFIAILRDITSQYLARQSLKVNEERFRSLTSLSSDWYWETDCNDRFIFVSEGVQAIFGERPDDFLGRSRSELMREYRGAGMDEYRLKVERRQSYRDIHCIYHANDRKDSTHISIAGEPIFDNDVFCGYRGVGRDITTQIQNEQRVAQLASENIALVENSLDMIVLFDSRGNFMRVNNAVLDILGYPPAELVGRNYSEFISPADADRTATLGQAISNGRGRIRNFEVRLIAKNGAAVHLSWSLRRIARHSLVYATARDITESYRTQRELAQSKSRLNAILESTGDAFFAVDREWQVTSSNLKSDLGRAVDHGQRKPLWEVLPGIDTNSRMLHQAMQSREGCSFEMFCNKTLVWSEVRVFPYLDGLSIFVHDATARHVAEAAVREGEQRFREVIEMTPAGYVICSADSVITDVNPALCTMAGYRRDDLIGQDIRNIFTGWPCHSMFLMSGGTSIFEAAEAEILHKLGHRIYVLTNAVIKRDGNGRATSLTAFVTDISGRKSTEARLEQMATHDALTGLPNRAALHMLLQNILAATDGTESVAVMFIDLDGFKAVNDSMGHDAGDILLRDVARRLKRITRPGDGVVRLGGDEFVVVARCDDGARAACGIAEKLLASLNVAFEIDGTEIFVGASIGISMFPKDGNSKDRLLQHADTAMYRAKASGRNTYRFFEAKMSDAVKNKVALELNLRRALEREEFELHYQPRVDPATMSVVAVEALIRWHHPVLGTVPPLDFIPLAEEKGMIEAIGAWVLATACKEARRLLDEFGYEIRISVNLSARQLRCPQLLAQVSSALAEAQLPPRLLELELTETALIDDMEKSVAVLKDLKELGIQLSVDDFGTGYSSLAYLQRFPLDSLKLDRSFINQHGEVANNFSFIKAFIDLAHALNLSVVAEGVETTEVLDFLRESGCDEAQGFLFAKALPVCELHQFFAGARRDCGLAGEQMSIFFQSTESSMRLSSTHSTIPTSNFRSASV